VMNVPLAPGSGSTEFRAAWRDRILPALDGFAPQLVIVSAGFDAHKDDPLAQLALDTADFLWLTEELLAIAGRHAQGRLISALEGGYDLGALADCVTTHVRALMRA
jgi:acetoin utilization deacetylase AcuC-like enzyme